MTIDSGKKAELGEKDWAPVRERLFSVDKHATPRVIVSVLMLRDAVAWFADHGLDEQDAYVCGPAGMTAAATR